MRLIQRDYFKLLKCWSCVIWIRQIKFVCKVANFYGGQIKGNVWIWHKEQVEKEADWLTELWFYVPLDTK